MGNAGVCMSLLLRKFRAKEIYNTKRWVSTSISEKFQFRLTDTFTNYHEIYPFSQRTSAVIFKDVFSWRWNWSTLLSAKMCKKKKIRKEIRCFNYWRLINLLYRISSALSTHLLLLFLKSVEMVMKWLQMQLYKHFCFKIPILHCNAIFSNIVLLIFTVNREAVFP